MLDLFSSYLRVELHYLQRGQYSLTDYLNERGEFMGTIREDWWADYLTLPVMVRFIADVRPAHLFLTAGPRMDVLLAYWQSTTWGPILRRSYFQPVNVGANWGVGAIIPLKAVAIIPEVRMSHTFNNAYRTRSTVLHPSALEVVVGLRF